MHNSNSRTAVPWNRGTERIFPSVSASVPSKYVIRSRYHPAARLPSPPLFHLLLVYPTPWAVCISLCFSLVPYSSTENTDSIVDAVSSHRPRSLALSLSLCHTIALSPSPRPASLHVSVSNAFIPIRGLHNDAHKTRMRSSVPHCDTLTLCWLEGNARVPFCTEWPHLCCATQKMAKFPRYRSSAPPSPSAGIVRPIQGWSLTWFTGGWNVWYNCGLCTGVFFFFGTFPLFFFFLFFFFFWTIQFYRTW